MGEVSAMLTKIKYLSATSSQGRTGLIAKNITVGKFLGIICPTTPIGFEHIFMNL